MQMEYSLEKNVCISSCWMFASDSVSLPRLDNPTGACPTHRRQWADFLVSLMAPLHRHRLRAVMFCSEVPIRDTHKSPTNCLPGYGHDPRSAPNLERHGSSKMQTFGWLEMPHFLNRISIHISIWNPTVWSFDNITYQSKEVLCLLRQFLITPILCRLTGTVLSKQLL